MTLTEGNGGFPLPVSGRPQRVVEATHAQCAGRTRVALPAAVPTRAVRRVVCDHCERAYEPAKVIEVRRRLPRVSLPKIAVPAPRLPSSVDPRWVTLPIAALAVFGVLSLVSASGDEAPSPDANPASITTAEKAPGAAKPAAKAKGSGTAKAAVPSDAQLVSESSFSLALPAGWDRVNPAAGATFAAVSADGTADATLWIQNDPKLDMATFEADSLKQLETLAGSARVVEREIGPTVDSSSITLAPEGAPAGAPTYEVVLRGSGDNWYYLATTYQPSAPAEAISGVELIQGSFAPQGAKK